MVAGLAVALTAAPPGLAAHAEPKPSGDKELTSRALHLADQLEQLTEQYNGLRVKLREAQAAAKAATATSRQQNAALEGLRARLSRLAATTYMQAGGNDPAVSFVASANPQQVLDRAATLRYFATQNSTQFVNLLQTMQAADRAFKAAQQRAQEVGSLRGQVDAQRTKVSDAYEQIRGQLVKRHPESVAKLPVVGDNVGARALRAAMTKLGDPYVWGASGPSSFDCSGLVMWAYEQLGVNLPHYTGDQWNAGTHVTRDRLRPGDLVFFYPDLHHMGLYVGAGKILHAPHTGDVVRIDNLAGRPFAGAVRIAH
ncbi:NlpC/P60 family protein [Actinomadura harenae]|uniref:NlpC/P60 family protein n=1 Tax=Actinomadura harenae TaxID=2483351 RepID=A0A3M2M9T9_9ACTN|nr:NlpC/P60 family protein [Actinomadura harenae]